MARNANPTSAPASTSQRSAFGPSSARTTAYAFAANWNHQVQSRDYGVAFTDIGKDFRADLGFLPQVGYRELNGYYGLRWYPLGFLRFVRASLFADEQQDSDGNTIYRRTSPRH